MATALSSQGEQVTKEKTYTLAQFLKSGGDAKHFKRFDKDRSGVLEHNEIVAYLNMKKMNNHVIDFPNLTEWKEHSRAHPHLISLWIFALLVFSVYVFILAGCTILSFQLWDSNGTLPAIVGLEASGLDVKAPGLSPTNTLSTLGFSRYICCILAITMVSTGLGMEVILGGYFVTRLTNEGGEILWHGAQFLFSLMLTVAIVGKSAFSFPFVVFGLYKFGFPETIGYLLKAWKTPASKPISRVMYFSNGIGLLLHHSAGAFYVAALATGVMELVRVNLAGTVILIVQHWFVPLKYSSIIAYNLIELALEIVFEFEVITALQHMTPENGVDTTARACALVMLVAHWFYLAAAIAEVFLLDFCGLEGTHVDNSGGESFAQLRDDLEGSGVTGPEKYGSNCESVPLASSAATGEVPQPVHAM